MRRVLPYCYAFTFCFAASVAAQSPKAGAPAKAAPAAAPSVASPAAVQAARASYAKLPLSFEENVGQTDGRVKYMSRSSDYNLFLTADQAVFALRDGSASPNCTGLARKTHPDCADSLRHSHTESVLWLKMLGANASAQVAGSDLLPGKINYYVGNDPGKWHTGVRLFGRVSYQGIYPGVNLTYYGNGQQLESDFLVAPGANPRSIQFELKGARETRIDAQGNLVLASDAGNVRLLRPVVYQNVNRTKVIISGRYVLLAENRVGFDIGKYDAREPLIIDPTFVYSTYLGGGTLFSGGDQALAIAIDASGAAYVTGLGSSSDFPGSAPSGPVAQAFAFAFVTKFDPTGNTLMYSTLLRGTTGFSDSGNGIGVDSNKNAYVDGITGDSDFPLLNPFQATIGDVFSAGFNFLQSGFVAGLDGNGALIYSTYFGGRNNSDQTTLSGLAVDAAGNAYVVGDTTSNNFPTVNPFQSTLNSTFGSQNAVVAKFNPQGQPIYSTYLGGSGPDIGTAITIDGNGNAYVTGKTSSNASFGTGFPVKGSPFQSAINGSENAFVSKFGFASPNLTLANSTYLGGSASDEAFGIAVDSATPPNVYLTGQTTSTISGSGSILFPTQNQIFGPQSCTSGSFAIACTEAFVTKLKGDFSALVYSTFLGGTGTRSSFDQTGDAGLAIALDGATPLPNAFVTGKTTSSDFPRVAPLQSTIGSASSSDAFVTEVNGAGTALSYSTFLGGAGSDVANGIAVDSTGNAYITGSTSSPNFPVSGSGGAAPFQGELGTSAGDAFVAKISPAAAPSALNFFPPAFNFHSQGVGQASPAEPVTLSNNTALAVTINVGGITFTGANAGDFSQTNTCPVSPATLAAGANCSISVVFNPTLQDSRTAQLSVASSAPPATMNLSGFGAVPEVSLSSTNINFGTNNPLNVPSFNFLSITNKGGAPLHVGSVEITGTNPSAFAVTDNSCANVPANGGSCFLTLTFTPTAAQGYTATLLINDDAAGSPRSVNLSGTGVGLVIVTPHSLAFGGWLVGTSSFDSAISLLNGSGGNITLTSITPSGGSVDFPIDPSNGTTCVANLVLLPGISCNLDVPFKPGATGSNALDGRTATYTFSWTGTLSGSQAVTLTGTAETGFTLYQNSFTASSEFVGATERRVGFDQVFNGNSFPVTVTSIVLSGANPQDYVVQLDTSCSTNGVVPANSVCYLDGSFSPSAVGTRTGTATINYNPPSGGFLVLSLSGTGLAGPVSFPSSYDMGSQIVGITGPAQRVVLQNVQKAQLTINLVTPPAGTEFAIAPSSTCKNATNTAVKVPGGGNCFFDLTFTPGGTGSRTASLTVTDDGPGSPRTLNLTGTGEPAADTISVTPNALDFGNVVLVVPLAAQPTVSQTFYLTNAGSTSTTINFAPALATHTLFGLGSGTCTATKVVLPQGGSCTVVVTFKPTGTGKQTDSVTLTDSNGGLHTVPVQATGVNQGVMSFGTAPTFNQLPSTTSATPLKATLTNSGSGPLTINSLYLSGTNSTDFAIVPGTTTCAPGTTGMIIPAAPGPNNSCDVALTFTSPSTLGSYGATVSVSANLGNGVTSSASTSITGNVVAALFSASPNPINFGTVSLGNAMNFSKLTGNFSGITLTNNNPTPITITSIAPQTAGDYTVTNSCPMGPAHLSNLNFQNTCTFDVTLTPTVNGAEPANSIVVTYNAGGPSIQFLIPLNGAGSNALVAMPNPLNVSGSVGGNQFSSPTVTIGNGSSSMVNITGVGAITGAGASNFTVSSDGCTGGSLFPSGNPFLTSCQIFLNYAPTAPGTNVAAQIPVMYNIGGGATQTLTVNLNSSATAAQVSITPSQTPPTPLIFGNQVMNTQSLVLSVLVTNTGNDVLNFSGLKITGTNSNDFALAPQQQNGPTSQYANIKACSSFGFGSISPGQSCTIPITFTPAPPPLPGGTTRNATLTITDNAYPSKTQTVLLEGNAVTGVNTSTNALVFGSQPVGTPSSPQSVTLNNPTSGTVTVSGTPAISGTNASDFIFGTNTCTSGANLPPTTGSCIVNVIFKPGSTGGTSRTATLTIADSPGDAASPHNVTLSGTAVVLTSIAVTPANPSVAAGNKQQFTATGTFSDSSTNDLTSSVVWASGTTTVATINGAGLATTLKAGTSTMSATSGSVSGSTTLTVTAAVLTSIAVTPANPTILVAATQQFTATGTFSDNSTQNLTSSVTWASGTPATATISAAGLATAVKAGSSTIGATSGAVSGSTLLTVTNATLVSIAVTPANPSVAAGKTQPFTATGTFSDSSKQDLTGSVTWASGTTATATINAAGLATALKIGTSTISATSGSVSGSTTLTVTAAVLTSIAVTPANPSVAAGNKQQFTATGTFSDSSTQNLTSSVTWASATPATATINAAGLATAVKIGTSTISATSGSVSGSTVLTVTAAVLTSIAVTPANPSVAAGKTQQFTATGTFSDTSTQDLTSSVTWASGTTATATINAAGLATAVKIGTSTISATSGSVSGSTVLTVTAAVLTSIAVTPANPSVAAGNKQQFTATGTFSDNSTQNLTSSVTWTSGTPATATIGAAGVATAVKIGTSTISATSGSVSGSTVLTVTAAVLASIAVTPANPSVAAGKTQQFTATGTFSDNSTQNLTGSVVWGSGTTTAATINAAGLATTLKVGTSTISATSGSVVGSTTLTVTAAVLTSIAVTPSSPTILVAATQQFTATGTFSDNSTQNLTSSVVWGSATTATATINAAGLATAVKAGSSTISATSGSVSGSTTLTVTNAALVSIAVTPANPSIPAGKTQAFTATGTFSDNSTQNLTNSVTWSSSDTTVATIGAAGVATGVKLGGPVTIKAASGSINGTTTLTVTAAVLASIAVTPANPSVAAGKTQQFTATGTFSDNSTQDLTSSVVWASATPTTATLNAAGLATAVKAGTSTISATSGSVVGSTTLTVTAAVLTSIAVTPTNPSIPAGKTQQFTATGTFSDTSTQNLTNSVTWSSSDTTVATINAAGLATAVKTGGPVTIKAVSGTVNGTTTLTMTAAVLVSIAVTPANPSVAAGKTQQFTATGTFSDNSTQNLTGSVVWGSGTTTVATINAAGLATTLKVGTSTIGATSGSVVGSTTLTVTAAVLTSIAVTPSSPTILVAATQQFTATGTFSDSSTQDLTGSVVWASGTTTVATINAAGLGTAVKAGSSTISATSGSVSGSTTLTVTNAALVSIAVTPANPSIPAGKTQAFTATGTFSDNSTQNLTNSVTWSSSDTTVATIGAAGVATGVKLGGPVTIKAASGSINGTTTLTVTAALLSSIAVTPANPSLLLGNTQQFTATGTFSDNSTHDLTGSVVWASGTTAVATINAAGLATTLKTGTSTITATSGSVAGSTLLTVNAIPVVTTNPVNQTVNVGSSVTFTAAAGGSPVPTEQWQVSVGGGPFSNVPNATSTTLTFPAAFSQNGNKYQVVFTNSVGTATTTAATLTVTAPDVTVSVSHAGDFTVGANGVYTIKVTNAGTGATSGNITVTDPLPAGLTFVSNTGAGWACAAGVQTPPVVTCAYTGASLAATGGSSTVTLTASVAPGAFPSVTNSATVANPNDGKSNDKSATDAATNIDNVVPTQSAFSPSLGLIAGATSPQQITIAGTGFNGSTQVTLGTTAPLNTPLTGTANTAGTSLTFSVPVGELAAANAGSLTLSVTNPKNPTSNAGGGKALSNQSFPLVGFASFAPHTGTPNPAPIVAGTPFALQMDLSTTPSGAALPADVNVTCSFPTALTGATCNANPATFAHGATSASAVITINAVAAKSGSSGSSTFVPWTGGRGPWSPYLPWLVVSVLLSMLAMIRAVRRAPQFGRAPVYLTLVLLVLAAGTLAGCTTMSGPTPTPTGPSTITVTATTADGATVSSTVNITVSN